MWRSWSIWTAGLELGGLLEYGGVSRVRDTGLPYQLIWLPLEYRYFPDLKGTVLSTHYRFRTVFWQNERATRNSNLSRDRRLNLQECGEWFTVSAWSNTASNPLQTLKNFKFHFRFFPVCRKYHFLLQWLQ